MYATPRFIEDKFINTWHPRYDETENDEPEYKRLLKSVQFRRRATLTLPKQTFTEILNWKSARVKGRIDWSNFVAYAEAIRKCEELSRLLRMELLVRLPGIGAPVASAFLHFLYPSSFPIIDRRTVDVLRYFGYIRYKSTGVAQYPAFMTAVLALRDNLRKWSLREIDRAIFAYHKQNPQLFGTLTEPLRGDAHLFQETTPSPTPPRTDAQRNINPESSLTNHEMIAAAVARYRGKILTTSDIKKIVRGVFPQFSQGSLRPNDHAHGNKSPCSCAGTNRRIFDRIELGKYLIR